MQSPSVCFIGKHMFSGIPEGHKIASSRIIEAAYRSGVNTKVITIEDSEAVKSGFHVLNCEQESRSVFSYPIRERHFDDSLPAQFLDEMAYSAKVAKKLRDLDCDIVHYLNITKEIISVYRALYRVHQPCIAHLYHSEYAFRRPDFGLRLASAKIGFFNYIFATNKSVVRYLVEKMKMREDRVYYVPFPIDTDRFRIRDKKGLREKYDLPADAPIVVYVGAIYPDRGVFELLSGFRKLLKHLPDAMLFVSHSKLDGDEAEHTPHFYRVARNREFQDRVVLRGPMSHIEEIYCLSDVVVLPFTQPYWITDPPLVLLEAMASGVPIVTVPFGAIGEIGTHMENLIFFTPGDSGSLAETLRWVLENRDEAERIGRNAREIAEKEFSMETVGERLRCFYQGILQ